MRYYLLEKKSNLSNGYRKLFAIGEHFLMLIQHDGRLSLLESHCPHAGYSMVEAKIIGSDLRCPMHGYLFNIESGACTLSIEGPCRDLNRYELTYDEDTVGVML